MDEKHLIRLNIAERYYPLKIDKEEDEERIRKAALLINDRLANYRQRYSDKDVQDLLAMVALQFVVKLIELETKANSSDDEEKLLSLSEMLDGFLNKI